MIIRMNEEFNLIITILCLLNPQMHYEIENRVYGIATAYKIWGSMRYDMLISM